MGAVKIIEGASMIKPDNRPYGRSENLPTGLRPWKCTPIPACGGTSTRWDNKTPVNIRFKSFSTLSTGCCAPACGGKVVAPATKGGCALFPPEGRLACFPSPARAVVKVLETGGAAAHLHPLNLLHLLHPLNPHALYGVSIKAQAPTGIQAPRRPVFTGI